MKQSKLQTFLEIVLLFGILWSWLPQEEYEKRISQSKLTNTWTKSVTVQPDDNLSRFYCLKIAMEFTNFGNFGRFESILWQDSCPWFSLPHIQQGQLVCNFLIFEFDFDLRLWSFFHVTVFLVSDLFSRWKRELEIRFEIEIRDQEKYNAGGFFSKLFVCLCVVINPENPFFASRLVHEVNPWEYIHSGRVALPAVPLKVNHRLEPLYRPSEVNTSTSWWVGSHPWTYASPIQVASSASQTLRENWLMLFLLLQIV